MPSRADATFTHNYIQFSCSAIIESFAESSFDRQRNWQNNKYVNSIGR